MLHKLCIKYFTGTRLGSQNQVIARMVGRILGIDVSLNPISIKPGAEDSDYFN